MIMNHIKIKNQKTMNNKNSEIIKKVLFSSFLCLLLFSNVNIQAQRVQTDYCSDLTVTAVKGSDNTGCYVDVKVTFIWTDSPGTNPLDLPHGITFNIDGPAKITGVSNLGGTWIRNTITNQALNDILWNRPPSGLTNVIPSNQTQSFRVYIDPLGSGVLAIRVSLLTGFSWGKPDVWNYWSCQRFFNFTRPVINYKIIGPKNLCAGKDAILTLSPTPSANAKINWYRLSDCSRIIIVGSGGEPYDPGVPPVQTGGTTYPTGQLNSTYCYVAIIKEDCFTYVTNFLTINVCKDLSTLGPITATGGLNGENHACKQWSGTLTFPSSNVTCSTHVSWEKSTNSGTTWSSVGTQCNYYPVRPPLIPLDPNNCRYNTGLLTTGDACVTKYDFRVKINNDCGETYRYFSIFIDHETQPGTLQADPNYVGTGTVSAPKLCYDGYTILRYSGGCGKIVRWEYNDYISEYSPWTSMENQAGQSSEYWTNKHKRGRVYRVWIKNGACSEAESNHLTVYVKSLLNVNISVSPATPCRFPKTLKATGYSYPVNYQWYKDGVAISGAINRTLIINSPGDYYVTVKDPACNTEAQSNVITICGPPQVIITGPSCICEGQTAILRAVVTGGCSCSPYAYQWRKNGVIIPGNTSSITVSAGGSYTVTAKCNYCKAVSPPHTLTICP